jgi:hypothetical protein
MREDPLGRVGATDLPEPHVEGALVVQHVHRGLCAQVLRALEFDAEAESPAGEAGK